MLPDLSVIVSHCQQPYLFLKFYKELFLSIQIWKQTNLMFQLELCLQADGLEPCGTGTSSDTALSQFQFHIHIHGTDNWIIKHYALAFKIT